MKRIIAFSGSPRSNGNSTIMLRHFLDAAREHTSLIEEYSAHDLHLEYCRGCLRCNLMGRCTVSTDNWQELSNKIANADTVVFASPVYFHHVTAPLKKLIDRFRSFLQVQITKTGLIHAPHRKWDADIVLLLTMGSPDTSEAAPVVDLFRFMRKIIEPDNQLHVIHGTRLAMGGQIEKSAEELAALYPKLKLPAELAAEDYQKNRKVLEKCMELGKIRG